MSSQPPTVKHGFTVYRLPFARLFRPLTEVEATGLRQSVEVNGVLAPVLVYDSPTHGPDCVVDGGNRLALAAELGIDLPFRKLAGIDDAQAEDMAESLNADRRHLSPEEQRERREARIVRVAAKRSEGKSLRTIADEEGVSAEQVRQDVKAAGVKGLTTEPAAVTGKDGKEYPATKPEPTPAPTPSEEWHTPPLWDDDEPPEDADQVSDDAGPPEVESDFVDESDEDRGQPADRITAESLARLEHEYAGMGDYEAAAECMAERQELESVLDAGDGAPVNRVPRKKLPKGFKPGNHVDPDHPFADVLNGMSAFAAKVTAALRHEKYGQQLIEYLSHCRFLTHTGERYVDGEIVPAKARFTALKWFRRVIHLAGLPGKRLDKEGLLKRLKGKFDDEPEFLAEDFE